LDVASPEARIEGSKVIVERIKRLKQNLPIVLLGDFNSAPGQSPYDVYADPANPAAIRFEDAWENAKWKSSEKVTYHHFMGKHLLSWYGRIATFLGLTYFGQGDMPWWSRMHIDWILYRNPVPTGSHQIRPHISIVATEKLREMFPSDHFPVVTLFEISTSQTRHKPK